MDNIPLSRPSLGEEELAAVAECFASGWIAGQGPQGVQLESEVAHLTGRAHAAAVSNCTAGLHLALLALGIGPGDEVIVADYTFPATAHAVLYTGARVVPVDVRADTGTIDTGAVAASISARTRAVIGVDTLGMPADWAELERISRDHGLRLIADAACSLGAEYRGSPAGAWGDVAVFSLHARKGVTSGEGGIVVTDDEHLATRVKSLASFGISSALDREAGRSALVPQVTDLGFNYKMSDILAAVARVQVGRLEELTERRRTLVARYVERLAEFEHVSLQREPPDRKSSWQTFAVRLAPEVDRDAVVAALRERGVGSNFGTYSLSRQPLYRAEAVCPVASDLFDRHLALPLFPGMSDAEVDRCVDELAQILRADPLRRRD